MRSKLVARNFTASIVSQFLSMALNFVARTFFIRYLGVNYLGLHSLFSNILVVLSVSQAGLDLSMMYNLYKSYNEKDMDKVNSYLSYYRKIFIYVTLFLSLFALGVIPFLGYIVKTETPIAHVSLIYLLYLISEIYGYFFIVRIATIKIDQKTYIITYWNLVTYCLSTIAQILVLVFFQNIFLFIILKIVIGFISKSILSIYVTKKYNLNLKVDSLTKIEKKSISKKIRASVVDRLSSVLINNTDNIIISVIISTTMVGFYTNYFMVINILATVVYNIIYAIVPSLGNKMYTEKNDLYNDFKNINFVIIWVVSFCAIGFILLSQDFILMWIGKEFLLDFKIVIVMGINLIVHQLQQSSYAFVDVSGLYEKTKYATFGTSIINIFLSILLGLKFKLIGVLLATFISRLVLSFWFLPFAAFKYSIKKPLIFYFLKTALFLGIFIAIGFLTFFICELINFDGGKGFFVKLPIVIILPNLLFSIFTFKTSEFKYLKKQIFRVLGV